MIRSHYCAITNSRRVLFRFLIASNQNSTYCIKNSGFVNCATKTKVICTSHSHTRTFVTRPVFSCQKQDSNLNNIIRCYSSSSTSTNTGNPSENYVPTPEEQQEGKNQEKRLRRNKKLFSSILFTSTLVLIAYARRKKQDILNENFEGCVRLPVDEAFHGGHREFFRCHSNTHESGAGAGQEKTGGGKGCVLPAQILKDGTVKAIKSLDVRPDDVIVASFPKTGTTWVQEIVYLIKNDLDFTKASEKVLENRFPYLEYPYPGLSSIIKQQSPRLIKTHLPLNFLPENVLSAKVIYITRNPKDTVVSYFHFARMLAFSSYEGSFEDFVTKFKNDELPYCPFFGHIESYTNQQDNPNLLIVTYEDLTRDPAEIIKKIAKFLDKPLSDSEISLLVQHTSFKEMAKNPAVNYAHWDELGIRNNAEAQFMRKGKVGDWKNYFNALTNQDFDDWVKEGNKTGFKFEYDV